jgi:GT2 family glycosyltransferase
VVTPFFDTAPVVFAETSRSVLSQTLQQFEWLIVDDASTSTKSRKALEEVAQDPRVRILHHSANRGLSAARNTGFDAAKTDFVVQLDSDDLLEPTAIEKWWWCLATHDDLAFCKGFTVIFGGREQLWRRGFHNGSAFLARNQTEPTAMIRRRVHQDVGGYEVENRDGLEDWEFWLRCANAGFWGATVPEFLGWHRWRSESDPQPWKNWDEGRRQRNFRRRLRQRYPSLWRSGIPKPTSEPAPGEITIKAPDKTRVEAGAPGHLLLLATDGDAADATALDRLRESSGDAPISIVIDTPASHGDLRRLDKISSDTFVLPHFLPRRAHHTFLSYLVQSRNIDTVLISSGRTHNSAFARLGADLPNLRYIDAPEKSSSRSKKETSSRRASLSSREPPEDGSCILRAPLHANRTRIKVYLWLVAVCDPVHRWLLRRAGRRYRAVTNVILRFLLQG